MSDKEAFEIPDTMRDMAERNVEQARDAYHQMMEMTRQAQQAVTQSGETATTGAADIQRKAVEYAEANMNASFDFAAQIARVSDMQNAFKMQQEFAQSQMQTITQQTQELTRMMGEIARPPGGKS